MVAEDDVVLVPAREVVAGDWVTRWTLAILNTSLRRLMDELPRY